MHTLNVGVTVSDAGGIPQVRDWSEHGQVS